MGPLKPEYPVWEASINVVDRNSANKRDRLELGDIVGIRPPLPYIGSGQTSKTLWVLLEGLEFGDFPALGAWDEQDRFYKRRYCIPFHRLPPNIDMNRVLDASDPYQPFEPFDFETGFRLESRLRPLSVHGLVFDKLTGEYL